MDLIAIKKKYFSRVKIMIGSVGSSGFKLFSMTYEFKTSGKTSGCDRVY